MAASIECRPNLYFGLLNVVSVAHWDDGMEIVRIVGGGHTAFDRMHIQLEDTESPFWGWAPADLKQGVWTNLAMFLVLERANSYSAVAFIGIQDDELVFVEMSGFDMLQNAENEDSNVPARVRGFLLETLGRRPQNEDSLIFHSLGYPWLLEEKDRIHIEAIEAKHRPVQDIDPQGKEIGRHTSDMVTTFMAMGISIFVFRTRTPVGDGHPDRPPRDRLIRAFDVRGSEVLGGTQIRLSNWKLPWEYADSPPSATLLEALTGSGIFVLASDWEEWRAERTDPPVPRFDLELYQLLDEPSPLTWPRPAFLDFTQDA